jgi:large subunit ribosomal protein L18
MSKYKRELARKQRARNRSKRTARFHPTRPRLCVYRSNRHIEAQIIDDFQGRTLVSASSLDRELREQVKQAESKVAVSKIVGTALARRAQQKKIKQVVFDRNGFAYHGRVRALAEAARDGGLSF